MGNRSDRIDYCRSRDRVSIEWLSWQARSADLIDKGTYVKSTSASVRHRTHGASSVFAFRPRQEYRRAGERGAGMLRRVSKPLFFANFGNQPGVAVPGVPSIGEHLAFGVLHCMGLPNVKSVEDLLGILMQEGG